MKSVKVESMSAYLLLFLQHPTYLLLIYNVFTAYLLLFLQHST